MPCSCYISVVCSFLSTVWGWPLPAPFLKNSPASVVMSPPPPGAPMIRGRRARLCSWSILGTLLPARVCVPADQVCRGCPLRPAACSRQDEHRPWDPGCGLGCGPATCAPAWHPPLQPARGGGGPTCGALWYLCTVCLCLTRTEVHSRVRSAGRTPEGDLRAWSAFPGFFHLQLLTSLQTQAEVPRVSVCPVASAPTWACV